MDGGTPTVLLQSRIRVVFGKNYLLLLPPGGRKKKQPRRLQGECRNAVDSEFINRPSE